jgi:glycerol-3-phosphate dehydrogenase
MLAERDDFVSGASSNTMKTIHGGIRFDRLKLVQAVQSIRASAELGRQFPDLVQPLSFVIPNGSLLQNRFTAGLAAGLFNTLVHLFAGDRPTIRATVVPLADYGEHYARFSTRLGKTAFQWCDLQVVESELLALRMLQAAARRGARIENYLGVVGIEPEGDAYGVTFECSRSRHQSSERFTDVFDCSGAGRAAERALGALDPTVDFVRAVNLVVPGRSGSRPGMPDEDTIRNAAGTTSELRCWSEEERARQIAELRAYYAAVQQEGAAHRAQAQSDQRPQPST